MRQEVCSQTSDFRFQISDFRLKSWLVGLASASRWGRLMAVILALSVGNVASAQQKPSESQRETATTRPPWLVTVVHRVNVRDLIANWRSQGIQVSALDGIGASQQITNITTGLVLDAQGRILSRLGNLGALQAQDITVLTSDGRTLHPKAVLNDEDSGYTVIEVADLNIAPPPFATQVQIQKEGERAHIIYQVPEMERLREALITNRIEAEHRHQVESAQTPPPQRGTSVSQSPPSSPSPKLRASRPQPFAPMQVKQDQVRLAQTEVDVPGGEKRQALLLDAPSDDWLAGGCVVLNEKNEVIGVAERVSPSKYLVNPIVALRPLIDQVVSGTTKGLADAGLTVARLSREMVRKLAGEDSRPVGGWLGIRATNLAELGPSDRAKFRQVPRASVYISDVIAESPAARAGLRAGDFILTYQGQSVASVDDLAERIAKTPIGQEVTLSLWRHGLRQQRRARIAERPAETAQVPVAEAEVAAAMRQAAALAAAADQGKAKTEAERSRPAPPAPRVSVNHLGIKVADLTDQLAGFFGAQDQRGVLVTDVSGDSPAERAGLRAGDVILKVNASGTINRQALIRVLREIELRGPVTITLDLVRERKPLSLAVQLSP
jgi:S1-C subfamily serine protease